ncbi:MAG: type II toxin-antitoxin system VapC family toxin [Culicoidibacterales bacterium]
MTANNHIQNFIPSDGEILVLDTNILFYIFQDDMFPTENHSVQDKFKPFTRIIELADRHHANIHIPKIVLSEFYNRMFDKCYKAFKLSNSTNREISKKAYRRSEDFSVRFTDTFEQVMLFMNTFVTVEKEKVIGAQQVDFLEEYQVLDFVDCELLNYCIKYGFTLVTADKDFKKYKDSGIAKIVSNY